MLLVERFEHARTSYIRASDLERLAGYCCRCVPDLPDPSVHPRHSSVSNGRGTGFDRPLFLLCTLVQLETVTWMLSNVLPYFIFAVIVIFQHEIRRALARFGQTPLFAGFSSIHRNEFYDE